MQMMKVITVITSEFWIGHFPLSRSPLAWSSSMIGATISHYKIIEKPGRAGLGVVWEVVDAKLKHRVALNVLPPERTGDRSAKLRFSQEAQSDSALQHPTTCTMRDVDQSGHARIFNSLSSSKGAILKEGIDRKRPRCKAKAERSSDQELIA